MSRFVNVFSALNSDSDKEGFQPVINKKIKNNKNNKSNNVNGNTINQNNTNTNTNTNTIYRGITNSNTSNTNSKVAKSLGQFNKLSLKKHITDETKVISTNKVNSLELKNDDLNLNSQGSLNSLNSLNVSKETINFEEFGNTKLNTPWCLWFHHDLNDWTKQGYQKIATFKTINEYVRIMIHLHMVTSIKNMNLCLFREGIDPTWEHKANANGAYWKIKSNMELGYDLWQQICGKAVTETLLNHFSSIDLNGIINGIAVTNKAANKIIKIWVADRKVSDHKLIDKNILNKLTCSVIFEPILPEH